MLTVVVPTYNEETAVDRAKEAICRVLEEAGIAFELLFVDDGSKDATWAKISAQVQRDRRVRGVRLSRNFGKESAIFAGLAEAAGDCTAVLDCDLQHPPEKLVEMYRLWEQGYEVVEGVKKSRGEESKARTFAAKCFYKLLSRAAHMDLSDASDFKLLDRKAVKALLSMPEKNAFFRALSAWVGFRSVRVEYDVQARSAGTSKWSTRALVRYAVANITAFTVLPMQIVTVLGVFMLLASFVLALIALYQKLTGEALGGFTTVIILQCFTGSVMMISLGIIGYYISKIYDEVKNRPRYIVAERTQAPERDAAQA